MKQDPKSTEPIIRDMEDIYKELCKRIKGSIYSWEHFKILRMYKQHGSYCVDWDRFSTNDMRMYFPEISLRREMHTYIKDNKSFLAPPTVQTNSYVYDDEGNMRDDLKGEIDNIYKSSYNVDLSSGTVNINSALPKRKMSNNKAFEELLYFCANEDETNVEMIKNFMTQLAFVHRRKGRPTLVLQGVRGSGKNLLVEGILRQIYPNDTRCMPSNYDSFSSYTKNKLVYLDETRNYGDLQLFDLCKQMSGAEFVSFNQKHINEKEIKSKTYMVLMSNDLSLKIPYHERPIDEYNNQWMVITYTKAIHNSEKFVSFVHRWGVGGDLQQFIDNHIGCYLYEVLLPHYKKTMHRKPASIVGRYGFPIPITEGLKAMFESNRSEIDTESEIVLEFLLHSSKDDIRKKINTAPDNKTLWSHYLTFLETQFISNRLLVFVRDFNRIKASPHNIKRQMEKRSFIIKNAIMRIDAKSSRGFILNMDNVAKIFKMEEMDGPNATKFDIDTIN